MSSEDGQFDAKVKVLKDLVEHHVGEEEGQMMPKAKKLLSSDELEELGASLESRKEAVKREPPRESSSKGDGRRSNGRRAGSTRASGKGARSPRPARSPRGRKASS